MKSPVAKAVTDLWTNLNVDLEAADFERLVIAVERCAVALEAIADRDESAPAQQPSIPTTGERNPAYGFRIRVANLLRQRPELSIYEAVQAIRDAMRAEQDLTLMEDDIPL